MSTATRSANAKAVEAVYEAFGRGDIAAMRHYVDTAKHIAAAQGDDTTVR